MPHSIPVSKLMILPKEWPAIRADADVCTAIKLLRIVTEDEKLEHGHSTPLVFDENYQLLGFVHLTDLLKSVKHLWEKQLQACENPDVSPPVSGLVVPFAGSVQPEDSILKALDIMMDHNISLVPVMSEGKLQGLVKLSDIFNTVAALLFDEEDPDERRRILRDHYL